MPDSPRQHWLGTPVESAEAPRSEPASAHEIGPRRSEPTPHREPPEPDMRRAHLLFGLFTVALLVAAALVLRLWG